MNRKPILRANYLQKKAYSLNSFNIFDDSILKFKAFLIRCQLSQELIRRSVMNILHILLWQYIYIYIRLLHYIRLFFLVLICSGDLEVNPSSTLDYCHSTYDFLKVSTLQIYVTINKLNIIRLTETGFDLSA